MGRKQKRLWKYILFFPVACLTLLIIISGCQLSLENANFPPQEKHSGQSKNSQGHYTVSKMDKLENQLLDQADASLKDGKLSLALQSVAKAVSCCNGHSSDRALNIIGRVLAHRNSRIKDKNYSMDCLKQLEAEFPETGDGATTVCWLRTLGELLDEKIKNQGLRRTVGSQKRKIKQLTEQIAQMKAVDLELVQPKAVVEVP